MDEDLIDMESLGPERQSLLPGRGFFESDAVQAENEREEAKSALAGAEVAVVADPDADGLACVALIEAVYDEVGLVKAGPHELEDGLEYVAEFGDEDVTVFICDLCPDRFEWIETELEELMDHAGDVHWYDHHQWNEDVTAAVREEGVDLVIGESDEECTADVAARELDDVPEHLKELAAVTRDHDLWIKEDPRSDDLADYARWSEDARTYVDTVREHGVDLPPEAMDLLAEHRAIKQDRIDRAVRRADIREIGEWTVGVTYGRCSQNEVAESLRVEEGADAAVIVKPAGSASIRGSESFERAHEVAEQVGGGGHPRAAGCKPDIYEDMLDYAHHWTTEGSTAKQVILQGFEAIAD